MIRLRDVSFRTKLLLVFGVTGSVTLILACSALVGYDVISSRMAMQRDLVSLAEVVGANSEAALAFGDAQSAAENLASLHVRPNIMAAALYAPDGTALARYGRRELESAAIPQRPRFDGIRSTRDGMEIIQTVRREGDILGRVYIRSDTRMIHDRVRQYVMIGLLVFVASGLVGLLLSARLQRLVSEPITALANAARTVSRERNYSVRVATNAQDELGSLTRHFNDMLEQIQARDVSLQKIRAELEIQLHELQAQIDQRRRAEEALRASEEQLRQSQKMEAVGLLAGGVAHDFNNLLTVICGYSQLAMAKLDANSPLRETLSTIKDAGDRAAVLTRQLLAFSRKQVLAPQPTEIDGVVSNMNKMLRRLLGENIEVVFIPGLGGARVMADAGQIEQVVLNLVVNARDAMPEGGKLTLETRELEIAGSSEGDLAFAEGGRYAVLLVSDTGIGMDEATRARIFEPFFTTKGLGKGTGLGLSTVYGIIRQSGGHITVDSAPQAGTTFRIYLPVCESAASRDPAEQAPRDIQRGSETILLVEDEDLVRRFARESLEAGGYRVIEAAYGSEAVALFEEHADSVRLLLTDVVMPQMNGREVARKLSEMKPGLPVVYMSGYVGISVIDDGPFDPKTNFIQKPFTCEALLALVRRVLDRAATHVERRAA